MNPVASVLILGLFGGEPQQECGPSPGTHSVAALLPGHVIDHGKSREELVREMGRAPFAGFSMQGLTSVDFSTSTRVTVGLWETASGSWCATADRAEVEFGFADPAKVMLAREIDRESCAWRTVLEHEMLHVRASERAVRNGKAAIEQALASMFGKGLAVEARDRGSAERAVRERVASAVKSEVARALAKAERENSALDTRESYERLQRMCP